MYVEAKQKCFTTFYTFTVNKYCTDKFRYSWGWWPGGEFQNSSSFECLRGENLTEQKRDGCNFSGKALAARDKLLRYLAIYFIEIFMSNLIKSWLLTTSASDTGWQPFTILKPQNQFLVFMRSSFLTTAYGRIFCQRTNQSQGGGEKNPTLVQVSFRSCPQRSFILARIIQMFDAAFSDPSLVHFFKCHFPTACQLATLRLPRLAKCHLCLTV